MDNKNQQGCDQSCGHEPKQTRCPSLERVCEQFYVQDARYRRFVEAMHDMRFMVGCDDKLIDVNHAGVEIFGYGGKKEMLGEDSFCGLFNDPEEAFYLKERVRGDGFISDYLVEMKKKDGSVFPASITASLWSEEDGEISFVGLLRDISEQRKWQRAYIQAEKDNLKLRESEEYSRQLNTDILRLVMIMSHDIRGPLVSIAAILKLLIRGAYGKMDHSVLNTLNDLLSRVAKLLGVAEDYLGKTQTIEGSLRIDREALDLRQDIIDPVLDELSTDILQQKIGIDNRLGAIPAGTIHISVNKTWLKAVFRNLFKNAIKYGGKGCKIAFGFEDHGSFYRLNVYNSGRPIPEECRDRLFTKFGRINAESHDRLEGIGMGLYLIREIIRKHGGDIWYEARPEGSDFVFTLAKEERAE